MAGQIPATRGPKGSLALEIGLPAALITMARAVHSVARKRFTHVFKNTMFGFPNNEFRNHEQRLLGSVE
jgi:hypothetical protein